MAPLLSPLIPLPLTVLIFDLPVTPLHPRRFPPNRPYLAPNRRPQSLVRVAS